jgi:hypothetical protein
MMKFLSNIALSTAFVAGTVGLAGAATQPAFGQPPGPGLPQCNGVENPPCVPEGGGAFRYGEDCNMLAMCFCTTQAEFNNGKPLGCFGPRPR